MNRGEMMSTEIANIYADSPKEQQNATALSLQKKDVGEIQLAMALAKQFPRDQRSAFDRIMTACQRQTLAERALYQYSRGGSDVSGPSIRLAEAMANEWGNMTYGFREIEQRNGESTVEAFAMDLETNVRVQRVFQIKHTRSTKAGVKSLTDPRDIYEMVANQGSRRVRACILQIIPSDVTDAAREQCEQTLKSKVQITPELIKRMLEQFEPFGVTKEHIEKRIQRKLDAITPTNVLSLKKILNSLADGMSKAEEWFDVVSKDDKKAEPISIEA
jgi:hypothetical protein